MAPLNSPACSCVSITLPAPGFIRGGFAGRGRIREEITSQTPEPWASQVCQAISSIRVSDAASKLSVSERQILKMGFAKDSSLRKRGVFSSTASCERLRCFVVHDCVSRSRFTAWRLFVYGFSRCSSSRVGSSPFPLFARVDSRANMRLCVFVADHAFLSYPHYPLNPSACSCVSTTLPALS